MKAIVDKNLKRDVNGEELDGQPNNVVIAIYSDEQVIISDENCVRLISPENLIYADLNSSNCLIVEGLDPPADFAPHKYTYDADADPQWCANPDYLTEEQLAARHEQFMAKMNAGT